MKSSPMAASDEMEPPLGELGWRGRFGRDDPAVARLRDELRAEAGLRDALEPVDPAEPGYAARAAALFARDGFVLIKDCLDAESREALRSGCDAVIRRIVTADPQRRGNRDSHRYSFAGAAVEFGHVEQWALATVDCPPVLAALTEIWGGNPSFKVSSIGGDFVMPGAVEFQELHADGGLEWKMEGGATIDARDMPPLLVCVCFPMEVSPHSSDGHTAINGATRFVRGTATSHEPIPTLAQEARETMLATASPVPAGWALIRDVRCWHGGTPNVGEHVRAIPASAFWAPWYAPSAGSPHGQLSNQGKGWLPREVWEKMSPHAQAVCAESVAASAEEVAETTWWSPETDLPAAAAADDAASSNMISGPGSGETVAVLPPPAAAVPTPSL